MTQKLSIEQLKFAREVGATHARQVVVIPGGHDYYKDISSGSYYCWLHVEKEWDFRTGSPLGRESGRVKKIDFTPLDEYYAEKAVDIAATSVPESSGEPLTWPISEELIGRKVRFDGYVKGSHSHWDYVIGEEYLIVSKYGIIGPKNAKGEALGRNFGNDFKFTLLPEQEIPDGYYHDDESGKLKPLKPAAESAHDRLTAAVKEYRNELGLDGAYDPVLVEAEKLLKQPLSKYHREIKHGVLVDVYDVISAWEITNPAQQHLAKKSLQSGDRGHKSYVEDMRDIIASAERAIEMFNENERTAGVNE